MADADKIKFSTITHPDYNTSEDSWRKYRYVLKSGREFIEEYLQKYSAREDETEFVTRRKLTYCPAFAKAALVDIRNSIYQRTSDIRRVGGGTSYRAAISGERGGVDCCGNSMDGFIGRTVLTELLGMGKVAVFVDKAPIPENATLADTRKIRPYLYLYKAEDVRSWSVGPDNTLDRVLLRTNIEVVDPDTQLVSGTTKGYKLLYKNAIGSVTVAEYDDDDNLIREYILNLSVIPLAIFSITASILEDAADYQIALLNMESSDVHYALKANFPFYTEQVHPQYDMTNNKGQGGEKAVEAGPTKGRRYPMGADRPQFIAPPTEPLEASMKKEEAIKADIRRIVNLNVSSMTSSRASGESKEFDLQGLEAGLAYIGTELQFGEIQIANIWAEYEAEEPAQIKYPTRYTLTSLSERLDMAKKVREEMPMVSSKTYQKEMAKEVATQLVGSKVSSDTLKMIHTEIDKSDIVVTDPAILKQDHEAGFVSTETASLARGYAKGEAEQAAKDHAERAARIVMAQTSARDATAAGAPDAGADPNAANAEKQTSQSADGNIDASKGTRGAGK